MQEKCAARPFRTVLISLKRFSRLWIFLLHSLKIPSTHVLQQFDVNDSMGLGN